MTEEKKPFWTAKKKRVFWTLLFGVFLVMFGLDILRYLSSGPNLLKMWGISPLIVLGFLLAGGFIRQKKWRWASFSLVLPTLALAAVEYYSPNREIPVRNLEHQRARALATDRVVQNGNKFDAVYDDREDDSNEIDLVKLEEAADYYAGRSQKVNQVFDRAVRKAKKLPPPSVRYVVDSRQQTWRTFGIEVDEGDAFWIRATGTIKSNDGSSEISTPDGLYADGMPTWHNSRVKAAPELTYRALMGRFCQGKCDGNEQNPSSSYTPAEFVGSLSLVCADEYVGWLQLRQNEFVGLRDGTPERFVEDLTFFTGRRGEYSFSIDQEHGAAEACKARRTPLRINPQNNINTNMVASNVANQ